MKPFKEQQQIDEAIDIKKALKKVKGLSNKQMQVIAQLPMPVITQIVNQLTAVVAQNNLDEKLVASDLTILDTILNKIKDDAEKGILELLVEQEEIDKRRESWIPTPSRYTRGYAKMYYDHVLQADQGADLDFLVGKDTKPVTRESH